MNVNIDTYTYKYIYVAIIIIVISMFIGVKCIQICCNAIYIELVDYLKQKQKSISPKNKKAYKINLGRIKN